MNRAIKGYSIALLIVSISLGGRECLAGTAIKFSPGAVDGCGAHVNRMNGGMALGTLDQYEDVSQFNWVVLNPQPASSAGLPDDRHIQFKINSAPGANGTVPAGTTFSMDFTMSLQSVDGLGGSKQYGVENPAGQVFTDNSRMTLGPVGVRYPTHVYVEASVQGVFPTGLGQNSYPPSPLAKAHPTFSQAKFRMFFDADGDPGTTADKVLIAKFGTTAAPNQLSTIASQVFTNVVAPDIIVNWDAAAPGVFTDDNGHELAIGAADASDPNLRAVSSAAQPTSEMEFSFRMECALTGACTTSTSNAFSFRLHTYDGYAGLIGVPASTVNPGRAACPPIPPIRPDRANLISPDDFPYLVSIETKCTESFVGKCLRTEIIKTCIGGRCFDVPPGKIPGPVCVRCFVGAGALGGMLIGGILMGLWRRRV